MLITPHIAIGAGLGNLTGSIWIAIVLSIVSHFILDALPHYDSGVRHSNPKNKVIFDVWDFVLVGLDVFIGLYLIYYFWQLTGKNTVLWAAVATFMVDFLDKLVFLSFKNGKLGLDTTRYVPVFSEMNKFHKWVHFKLDPKKWYWGVLISLLILIIGLYLVLL